jgi:phosphate/sulfate permease
MPDFFLISVAILVVLAVSDLIVGVSNDAVNFLNSAIGSKVADRKTIMIVSSIGIILGASLSSGMMEVARKGIFNPSEFYFDEVMVIFLAVMMTDILLLDLFNTFSLPTSTTVSIVFELLGASVAISVYKIIGNGESIVEIGSYINSSSALIIIAGIFLSVGIAFTIGNLVQYASRVLFSFKIHYPLSITGMLWSGLAMAVMTDFLLIKGLVSSGFLSSDSVDILLNNQIIVIAAIWAIWSFILFILSRLSSVNVLKIVVLFGTFSLAMAFAGNDLVNFIGVPVAGLESYKVWSSTGIDPHAFPMDSLQAAYQTNPVWLLTAGTIMVVTLWFSKKARSVTDTEVNLGRQHEGLERFDPNPVARSTVQAFFNAGRKFESMLPPDVRVKLESRFRKEEDEESGPDKAAFDLIRASVNLSVASALIALATSYKMPLSTTYVSFMVAMGTSLADRAWGRDSAVFRVSGVFHVVGGWFATAFIAFTVAGIFAILLYQFRFIALGILLITIVYLLLRTVKIHKIRSSLKAKREAYLGNKDAIEVNDFLSSVRKSQADIIRDVNINLELALVGLTQENLPALDKCNKQVKRLIAENEEFKYAFFGQLKRVDESNTNAGRLYLLIFDLNQDILQSLKLIAQSSREHIANIHSPLYPEQQEYLLELKSLTDSYFKMLYDDILNQSQNGMELQSMTDNLLRNIEKYLSYQIKGIRSDKFNARNSLLIFNLLLEWKDLITAGSRFSIMYKRAEQLSGEEIRMMGADT